MKCYYRHLYVNVFFIILYLHCVGECIQECIYYLICTFIILYTFELIQIKFRNINCLHINILHNMYIIVYIIYNVSYI